MRVQVLVNRGWQLGSPVGWGTLPLTLCPRAPSTWGPAPSPAPARSSGEQGGSYTGSWETGFKRGGAVPSEPEWAALDTYGDPSIHRGLGKSESEFLLWSKGDLSDSLELHL